MTLSQTTVRGKGSTRLAEVGKGRHPQIYLCVHQANELHVVHASLTFNTSASPLESIDISFTARWTLELVLQQVGVVGRGNEVAGQWVGHFLIDLAVIHIKDVTLRPQHELSEAIQTHHDL